MAFYTNETTLTHFHTVKLDELNRKGTMHGGNITKLLDDLTGRCGLEYNQTYVSTLAIHYVMMTAPLFPDDELKVMATITRTGKTSMFVRSALFLLKNGEETSVAEAGMTIVAVKDHVPAPVKPLCLNDELAQKEAKRAEDIVHYFKQMPI